jgi:chromosome segregation ATPase
MQDLAKHQDQRFGYVLNQLDAFLKTEDGRHDTYARELDRIGRTSEQVLTTLSEVAARQGKLEADHVELAGLVSDLGENLSETRGDVDVLKLDMRSVKTEIVAVKEELLTIKTTVGVIASEQAEMKASLAYMRQRLEDNPPPDAIARLMKPDADQ